MTDERNYIDKEQLRYEMELVEKILSLAENPATLDQADDLSFQLMKTQKTNTFDAVDINEYLAFLYDIQRHKREHDTEKAKGSRESANLFLEDTLAHLKRAKSLLQD